MLCVQISKSLIHAPQVAALASSLGVSLYTAKGIVRTLFLTSLEISHDPGRVREHPDFIKSMCGSTRGAWDTLRALRESEILNGPLHNYTLACDGICIREV